MFEHHGLNLDHGIQPPRTPPALPFPHHTPYSQPLAEIELTHLDIRILGTYPLPRAISRFDPPAPLTTTHPSLHEVFPPMLQAIFTPERYRAHAARYSVFWVQPPSSARSREAPLPHLRAPHTPHHMGSFHPHRKPFLSLDDIEPTRLDIRFFGFNPPPLRDLVRHPSHTFEHHTPLIT